MKVGSPNYRLYKSKINCHFGTDHWISKFKSVWYLTFRRVSNFKVYDLFKITFILSSISNHKTLKINKQSQGKWEPWLLLINLNKQCRGSKFWKSYEYTHGYTQVETTTHTQPSEMKFLWSPWISSVWSNESRVEILWQCINFSNINLTFFELSIAWAEQAYNPFTLYYQGHVVWNTSVFKR